MDLKIEPSIRKVTTIFVRLFLLSLTVLSFTACNLSVIVNGSGNGSVESEDGFIDCPNKRCQYSYNSNDLVSLQANAAEGFHFNGFKNPEQCINGASDSYVTGKCDVKMNVNRKVEPVFIYIDTVCPYDPENNCLDNPEGDFDGDGLDNQSDPCPIDPTNNCSTAAAAPLEFISSAQSSTFAGAGPERAHDGSMETHNHTNDEPNEYWVGDLGSSFDISYIVIKDRNNPCCFHRLNADLLLFESNPTTLTPAQMRSQGLFGQQLNYAANGNSLIHTFGSQSGPALVRARYIMVLQKAGWNSNLHMDEVEVWGSKLTKTAQ